MPNSIKCFHPLCKKKIKNIDIMIGKCVCLKCNNNFCNLHRIPESHDCSFNYNSSEDKDKFIKENKCVPAKLNKI